MSCALRDIRYTVRRAGREAPLLFPRLLRDRTLLPQLAMAIEYFDAHVGKERRELDAAMLAEFFGDPKLARAVIAALARTYRFRPRQFSELVGIAGARRLAKAGADAPRRLRLLLFDGVNERHSGFAADERRLAAYTELADGFRLPAATMEDLLYLDDDERAVLHRVGARARPEDSAAHFNCLILETLLRQAERVELTVRPCSDATEKLVAGLGAAHGVEALAEAATGVVTLLGRADALGVWSRHGRKVARLALELVGRGGAAIVGGEATLALPAGRFALRLTPEILAMLGGGEGAPDWTPDFAVREAARERVVVTVHSASVGGWSVRRFPDPQGWERGVVAPDLLVRAPEGGVLICLARSAAHGQRLATLAPSMTSGEPVVFVGEDAALGPLRDIGAAALAAETVSREALAEIVARYAPAVPRRRKARVRSTPPR